MLQGYNCTIFAYGQTGTGKTYTMSGDMSDTLGLLSDSAGIIPRVLHSLFSKLEADEAESSVKCSFIELYNEELRDLLSIDDSTKLKIYEDGQKKGHAATIVQGMEESHIKSAGDGIKLLQNGSHKRQVAATKCNDLSSRSHTVFTVTAYIKRTTKTGEDFVSAGKLNLVDLAGSENIQRSGAENKRAAEAGLINKSLLTLGRVINALVERGSHIPYRLVDGLFACMLQRLIWAQGIETHKTAARLTWRTYEDVHYCNSITREKQFGRDHLDPRLRV